MTPRTSRALAVTIAAVLVLLVGVVSGPASAATAAFTSDDFSGATLSSGWTEVDPVGDGTVALVGSGTTDARVSLSVPAGADHDPWNVNRSLRLMQPAADVDFSAEARWTTVPKLKYQSQGLIVEQDASNWMRIDVHATGTALRFFVSRTINGMSTTLMSRTVTPGNEVGIRVSRVGPAWTLQYSNGTSWAAMGTVQHGLAVTSVGPFAGNSGPDPAFVSEVDFLSDLADPIVAEDGSPAAVFPLTTTTQGEGRVLRSPAADGYPAETVVRLTAEAAPGWQFAGWAGDLQQTSEPVVDVTVTAALSVTATFVPAQTSEVFPLSVSVSGQGSVARSPSGSSFPAGTMVSLTAQAAEGWRFAGWGGDAAGTDPSVSIAMSGVRSVTASFEQLPTDPPPPGPAAVVSDDFSAGLLDTDVWTVVDPAGDGQVTVVGQGTGDVRLALTVPAGAAHEAFNTNRALRVVQPVLDRDFVVTTRFSSAPTLANQTQGLLVQQDATNWLRFDVHSVSTGIRVYAGKTIAGRTTRVVQRSVPAAAEFTLRVARSGATWTFDYSTDGGLTWAPGGQFDHAMTPTVMGPFVGNSGTNPAFTAEVDWFFDTAAPVTPEDGTIVETFPLDLTTVGQGAVARSPSAAAYPAGTEVVLRATPANGWAFDGWSGAASGDAPQATVVVSGPLQVTATFAQLPPRPPSPPVIDVWYGDDQTLGASGTPQRWVNVLGNVSDADGVVSLSYSLNGLPPRSLRRGPDLRRLYGPGDFNVQLAEADLPIGASTLVITAADATGDTSTRTVTLRKAPGSAALPHVVDWSTATSPNAVAQVVDGKWFTGPSGLTVGELGYDRTVAVGDRSWTDFEATVPVTVRALGPGAGTPQSGVPLVGLGLHWNGHTQNKTEEPAVNWFPTGAFAWHEWYGSGRFTLQGNAGSPLVRKSMAWQMGATYVMKARVQKEGAGVRYSYKWWVQGSAEPADWALSVYEDSGPGQGSLLLIAHHVDATFGTVTVAPL